MPIDNLYLRFKDSEVFDLEAYFDNLDITVSNIDLCLDCIVI